MYPIAFLPPAERYFKKIRERGLKDAFYKVIKEIRQAPFKDIPKKGDLLGIYGYDMNFGELNTRLHTESLKEKMILWLL